MVSQLIVLVVLIAFNAFFAAAEIAFISLNDAKIEKQAREGNKKAKQIEKMIKSPSKFYQQYKLELHLQDFYQVHLLLTHLQACYHQFYIN